MTNLNVDAAVTSLLDTLKPAAPLTPRGARLVTTRTAEDDQPQPTREETSMPRGVYDRSKAAKRKQEAPGGVDAPKKRRKRRANGAAAEGDVATLARESLVAAGKLLRAAVEECVELEPGNGDLMLKSAIANYDRAEKLVEAAG